MKTRCSILILPAFMSIIMIPGCGRREVNTWATQSFDSAVSIHLRAIATANLKALDPTVADSVTMISPFGGRTTTKALFMDLHRNWFRQTNWKWTPTILEKEYSDSLGYTLLRYRYEEKDSVGNSRSDDNYLVLIFRNSKEGWKLIHDQNTKIPRQ